MTGHRLLRGGVRVGGSALRRVPDAGPGGRDRRRHRRDWWTWPWATAWSRSGSPAPRSWPPPRPGTSARSATWPGPAACDLDARRDHPTGALAGGGHRRGRAAVPVHTGGDVLARFQQRAAEIEASAALLALLVPTLEARTVTGDRGPGGGRPAPRSGVGIVEGWRGTIVHRVELDADGTAHPQQDRGPVVLQLAGAAGQPGTTRSCRTSRWPTRASTSPTPATTCDEEDGAQAAVAVRSTS